MKKQVIETDREETTVIDMTGNQETVAEPAKKSNKYIWAVVALVIVALIVAITVYVKMQDRKLNQEKNGNS